MGAAPPPRAADCYRLISAIDVSIIVVSISMAIVIRTATMNYHCYDYAYGDLPILSATTISNNLRGRLRSGGILPRCLKTGHIPFGEPQEAL